MNRLRMLTVLGVSIGLMLSVSLFFLLSIRMVAAQSPTPGPAASVTATPIPPGGTLPTSEQTQLISTILTAEQNMVQATQNLIALFGFFLTVLSIAGALSTFRTAQAARSASTMARRAVSDARNSLREAAKFKLELDEARIELVNTKAQSIHDVEFLRRQVLHLSIAESVRVITSRDNSSEERLRELLELAQMLNPAAIRVFQFVLEYDTDPAFITNAAYGLAQLGLLTRGPFNQRLLLKHCESHNANIRESCGECLGEVAMPEDEDVMQKLTQMAESDSDPQVRSTAAEALSKITQRA